MPEPAPRPSALLLDPEGGDLAFLSRVLAPEFDIRPLRDPEAVGAAAAAAPFAVAFVVAGDDLSATRDALARVARARPSAGRVAVGAPSEDAAIFGLSAAGAEQVVARPLLETALRLAGRAACETFSLRESLRALEAGAAQIACDAAAGAAQGLARSLSGGR